MHPHPPLWRGLEITPQRGSCITSSYSAAWKKKNQRADKLLTLEQGSGYTVEE